MSTTFTRLQLHKTAKKEDEKKVDTHSLISLF